MLRLEFTAKSFNNNSKKPFFCFIFGAPGVGKGTYAKLLEKDLKLKQISTGNQIRKILKGQTKTSFDKQLISKIKEQVRKGGLISDEIVIKIIKEKIKNQKIESGVILDGFPRTKQQLQKYLLQFPLNTVLNITLQKDILLDKLMGRRTCLKCDISYNVCDIQRDGYSMPPMLPKRQGICDKCDNELIIREDDNEKTIKKRMEQYEKQTKPLLQQFERMNVLMNYEPKNGVKDYPEMKKIIQKQIL